MRILITGSRDWDDEQRIWDALSEQYHCHEHPSEECDQSEMTVVSGACPTGADAIAEYVAERHGWPVERHPANWSLGRGAGPLRNKQMVDLGADVCLAFIGPCTSPRCNIDGIHPTHGASGCADLAEKAGIPTKRYTT